MLSKLPSYQELQTEQLVVPHLAVHDGLGLVVDGHFGRDLAAARSPGPQLCQDPARHERRERVGKAAQVREPLLDRDLKRLKKKKVYRAHHWIAASDCKPRSACDAYGHQEDHIMRRVWRGIAPRRKAAKRVERVIIKKAKPKSRVPHGRPGARRPGTCARPHAPRRVFGRATR